MIFRTLLLTLLVLFAGCSQPQSRSPEDEKIAIADTLTHRCAEVLSERHQMSPCGEGGAMMYEVKSLFLAFTIYRALSKEEARAVLIDCAHEVIANVNGNVDIQKYLLPGGFTEKSVQIQVYIKPQHQKNYYPDIGVCSYDFGSLSYDTYDPDNLYRYKTSERETYQEAITSLQIKPYDSNEFEN